MSLTKESQVNVPGQQGGSAAHGHSGSQAHSILHSTLSTQTSLPSAGEWEKSEHKSVMETVYEGKSGSDVYQFCHSSLASTQYYGHTHS